MLNIVGAVNMGGITLGSVLARLHFICMPILGTFFRNGNQRITNPSSIQLHFGEHDIDDWDAAQFMVRPSLVIIHPTRSGEWRSYTYSY